MNIRHGAVPLSLLLLCIGLFCALSGCGTVPQQRKPPEQLYSEGVKKLEGERSLFFFHVSDYEGAESNFEDIKRRYSFTTFAPLAELRLADIHFEKEEYAEAVAEYDGFVKLHPNHEEVPYAVYRMGLSYYNQIDGVDRDQRAPEGALANFQTLLSRFPESAFAADAEKKGGECKETLAGNEFYIGKFYFKNEQYSAAAERFRTALERFPGHGPKEDALLFLGKSYMETDRVDKGREVLEKLIQAFPESEQVDEARELLGRNLTTTKEQQDEQ